ncbi:hypothetical protein [Arenibaculum pallidiluteum]|uniref:hypothetical protein n=1 Tax=Arenibaculum pallidiluteum TaxID=2812559 RepID=UPI001A95896B|nr:hypothetical protein [Arenibaculum pallidiluteum]
MVRLEIDGEMTAHMAGAIRDYVAKLREHQAASPSAAEKASYERTIEAFQAMLADIYAQS